MQNRYTILTIFALLVALPSANFALLNLAITSPSNATYVANNYTFTFNTSTSYAATSCYKTVDGTNTYLGDILNNTPTSQAYTDQTNTSHTVAVNCTSPNGYPTGLVSYWNLDEEDGLTAYDLLGANNGTLTGYTRNNGTLTGGASWLGGANCKNGACIDLNGSQYASIPNAAPINTTGAFTVSFWFKSNSTTIWNKGIVAKYTAAGGAQWKVMTADDDQILFSVWNSTGSEKGIYSNPFTTTNWNMITASFNGTYTNLYVNGAASGTPIAVGTATINAGTSEIWAGCYYNAATCINGSIDSLRIWDRALSASEIAAEYNSGSGTAHPTVKAAGAWEFDEGAGTNAEDTNAWTAKKVGNSSAGFDGVGNYVNGTNSSSFDLETFSISLWFKDTSAKDTTRMLITKRGSATSWWELIERTSGIRFEVYNGSTQVNSAYLSSYSAGTWYHAVAVVDNSAGTVDLYINGSSVGAAGTGLALNMTSTEPVYIGAMGGPQFFWNGSIDEVMVFNRSLTAMEIAHLYNSSAGRYITGAAVSNATSTAFSLIYWNETARTYDTPVYETNHTPHTAALDTFLPATNVSAWLNWSGTLYSATNNGSNVFNTTLQPGLEATNNTAHSTYWIYQLSYPNGTKENVSGSAANQNVIFAYLPLNISYQQYMLENTNYTANLTLFNPLNYATIAAYGYLNTTPWNFYPVNTTFYRNTTIQTPLLTVSSASLTTNATLNITFAGLTLARSKTDMLTYTTCYQETANVSTACGGLATGSYAYSGSFDAAAPATNFYDTDYATYAAHPVGGPTNGTVYVNYTKPTNSTNDSLWQVKLFSSTTNYSIPASCWNLSATQLRFRAVSTSTTSTWSCENSTGYATVAQDLTNGAMYEEAMYWNISNQGMPYPTVYRLGLVSCTNASAVLNYSAQLEDGFTASNFTLQSTMVVFDTTRTWNNTYNITHSNVSYAAFCINAPIPGLAMLVDSFQTYNHNSTPNYPLRSYFLLNATINQSVMQNITLYLNNDTNAYLTQMSLLQANGQAAQNYYLQVQRYYPGLNSYLTVAMAKTSDSGLAISYLQPNTIWYKIAVYNSTGDNLHVFSPLQIGCATAPCSLTLRLPGTTNGEAYEIVGRQAYNCTNTTNTFVCTMVDTSGYLAYARLTCDRLDKLGFTNVCDVNSTSSSSTLTCTLNNTNTTAYWCRYRVHNAEETPVLSAIIGFANSMGFGSTGRLLAVGIIITMAFVGLWSPVAAILLMVGAMVFTSTMGLLPFTDTLTYAAIPAAIIIGISIWKGD